MQAAQIMMNKARTLAGSVLGLLLAGQALAGDVVMFRGAAPAPAALAEILFPQADAAPPGMKFRGIRFTEPVADTAPVVTSAEAAQAAAPAPEAKAVGFNIRFAFNSAELLPETLSYLDNMAETLKLDQAAGQRVRIAGHADAAGSQEYNQWLSQARAAAVQDYLVERHGIALGRLQVTGFGESQPLAGSDPYDGVNRRVEFAAVQ